MLDVAAPRCPEGPEREKQQETTDYEDGQPYGNDDENRVLEVGLHRDGTVMMMQRPRNFPLRVEAAIFDFDETMIDLERQHTAAHSRLCRAMGASYEDMSEAFRSSSGRRVIDDIREMRAFFEWKRPLEGLLGQRQQYFDEEIASSPHLELMAGVGDAVRNLHARRVVMAIASSAVRSSIETILRRFDMLHLFATIVDGAEVESGKPHPQAYLVTADRLGVDPSSCLVFEDSGVGVQAAKAAGMYCVGVRNPRATTLQDLSPADLIVSSLEEIDAEWFATSSPKRR